METPHTRSNAVRTGLQTGGEEEHYIFHLPSDGCFVLRVKVAAWVLPHSLAACSRATIKGMIF